MGKKSRLKKEKRKVDALAAMKGQEVIDFFTSDFQSTHRLKVLIMPWERNQPNSKPLIRFLIGTVSGIFYIGFKHFEIVAFGNELKGNGHFQDVFDWFEEACRRQTKDLIIAECWNKRLLKHLIAKRGFEIITNENWIKSRGGKAVYNNDYVKKSYNKMVEEKQIKQYGNNEKNHVGQVEA